MAEFDFPTIIDQIYDRTKQKLVLVGHSQGAGIYLTGLSLYPEKEKFLEKIITLAPAASLKGFKKNNPVFYHLIKVVRSLFFLTRIFNIHSFFFLETHKIRLFRDFLGFFCHEGKSYLCRLVLHFLAEKNT